MKMLGKSCKISFVALCLLVSAKSNYSQTISPIIFGQNAWMPDTIGSAVYNGKLHNHWNNVKNSSAAVVRFGGISVDKNMPTNYQYIKMIDSILAKGMEPIIEVPFNKYQYTAQQAANIVQYINITKGRNVKYWTIGNEPDLSYSYTSASQVASYFKSFASAMKAVDPTIKIIGPDCAWFNQNILDGLTNPGGSNDITGKDGSGRYYLDFVSYHYYPFNGSQTRSQVITKLTQAGGYQDNLGYLKSRVNSCNTYHNRTGTSVLKMALTEGNISWQNASGDGLNGVGANSFIGGQFLAEMLCIGMKKGLDLFNMWSVVEGSSSGTTNIGYIDPSSGNKKPSYYHFKLLADNFSGNYANGTDNITNVKSFGSKNSQTISVLIMNQDLSANYNYTVRLNTGTVSGSSALKINIDAGLASEYSDVIQNQSTVLLTFNSSGNIIKKCEYKLSGHASANLPPACTEMDVTAPTVTSLSPADNATNVANNANLVIAFSEPIQKGSGNIIIKEGGSITQTIAVSGSNVSVSGNTVTINPADFSYSAAVNIEMASGVFKDLANNNYAGISSATAWNFTMGTAPDVTAPTVTTFNPADNATNVSGNANLVITFSEPIQKGSGNIIIKEGGSITQTIAVSGSNVSVSGNTVTINPADFSYIAAVNIEMASGVFKDMASNNYAGISSATAWNFTVETAPDVIAPTVTTFNPADNATNVSGNANLVMTFSEPIQKGSGNIIIKEGGTITQTIAVSGSNVSVSGNTVTINPADFSYSAAVNIEMASGVFKDMANNNYAGISSATAWNFTVETEQVSDVTPPTVISLSPADDAVNILKNSNLIITFNEPVKKGSGNIVIKESGMVKQTIAVSNSNVTVSGNTVTVNPSNFTNGALVNVEMAAGVFKDLANNNFAGIVGATDWNFTIKSPGGPTAVLYDPEVKAKNVPQNTNITIKFSENIYKGNGNIVIKENGSIKQIIDVYSPNVTIEGDLVNIDTDDFTEEASVTVEMDSGVFANSENIYFTGINVGEWDFTIEKSTVTDVEIISGESVSGVEIFPNPTKGQFTIKLLLPDILENNNPEIVLVNLAGQEVYRSNFAFVNGIAEVELDKNIANGIYILNIIIGEFNASEKIILEK